MKEMFLLMECQYAIIVGISMMLGLSVDSWASSVLLILQGIPSLERLIDGSKWTMLIVGEMKISCLNVLIRRRLIVHLIEGLQELDAQLK